VAFRTPCCDSKNTLSPRLLAEIFNATTAKGNFLEADSSVFNRFTADDPALPRELVLDEQSADRYARYVPFPSFANSVQDYPYPYVIGKLCWEFPCVTPSDWQSHNIQGDGNPLLIKDWEAQLDATVIKQGTFTLVFHPYRLEQNPPRSRSLWMTSTANTASGSSSSLSARRWSGSIRTCWAASRCAAKAGKTMASACSI